MSDGRWYYVAVGLVTTVAGLWAPQGHNAVGMAIVGGLCLGRACVLWMRDGQKEEDGYGSGSDDWGRQGGS